MGTRRPRAENLNFFLVIDSTKRTRSSRVSRGLLVYCGAIKSTLLGTTANTARAMFRTTHPAAIAAGFAVAGHPRGSGPPLPRVGAPPRRPSSRLSATTRPRRAGSREGARRSCSWG